MAHYGPRKTEEQKKAASVLGIGLSVEQRKQLEKEADDTGMTLSELAREKIFGAGKKSGRKRMGKQYTLEATLTDKDDEEMAAVISFYYTQGRAETRWEPEEPSEVEIDSVVAPRAHVESDEYIEELCWNYIEGLYYDRE